MVYCDNHGNMVTDCDVEELYKLAQKADIKKKHFWIRGSLSYYYDLSERMLQRAVSKGAVMVDFKDMLKIMKSIIDNKSNLKK